MASLNRLPPGFVVQEDAYGINIIVITEQPYKKVHLTVILVGMVLAYLIKVILFSGYNGFVYTLYTVAIKAAAAIYGACTISASAMDLITTGIGIAIG